MGKYIGGEFGRLPLTKIHHSKSDNTNLLYLMSGRTAMYAIVQDIISKRTINSIYVPSYCSRSMIKPILDSNINIVFYDINISENGLTIDYKKSHDCDCILLLDYFGFCNSQLLQIADYERSKGIIVIIDRTQSLLCDQPYMQHADYLLISFRKWFASNAAIAYSATGFKKQIAYTINQEYETLRDTGFLAIEKKGFCPDILDKSEEILRADYKNYKPSEEEISFIDSLDFNKIRNKRIANAQALINELVSIPEISLIFNSIGISDCPLYVPIILNSDIDRDYVVSELLKDNIECYVHWNFSQYHNQVYKNHVLYQKEISLFCDQRYSTDDMKHIANSLKKALFTFEAQHETY